LFKIINKTLKKLSNLFLLMTALLIIILTVSLSLTIIPTKLLAVAITTIGSTLGGILVTYALQKQTNLEVENQLENKEDEIKEKLLFQQKLDLISSKELELENLQSEIESLKSTKLNVSSVGKILELGVAKATMNGTNVLIKKFPKEDSIIGRDIQEEYLGILDYTYTAKLGINLQNVRLKDIDKNTIEVSGLITESLGNKNEARKFRLAEIREIKFDSTFFDGSIEVIENSPKLSYEKDAHYDAMLARINAGTDLEQFHDYVLKYTQDFLELLLAPLKKNIRFECQQNQEGINIETYFLEHNTQLNNDLSRLEVNKQNIKQETLQLLNNTITTSSSFPSSPMGMDVTKIAHTIPQ
jgi:hypothetical protein